MPFKPNYGRDRAERQRAAHARSEKKQRKKEEKIALRKAERAEGETPPDDRRVNDLTGNDARAHPADRDEGAV
jgi:hypothetical protein